MKTKQNNISCCETESDSTAFVKRTDSFSKLPDRYWYEKWYLKPNHHRIFNYLIYQAKWANSGKSIGRFSIGTYELSTKFGIPQKTVHRILQFLEKQDEITLQPTSKFTIVTVNHIWKSDLQNEKNDLQSQNNDLQKRKNDLQTNVVTNLNSIAYKDSKNGMTCNKKKMTYKNEKMTYKTQKVTTPIDVIDNIDKKDIKYSNENEIFVEKGINFNEKGEEKNAKTLIDEFFLEPEKVVENKSVKDKVPEKPKSEIDILLSVWSEEYLLSRKINYVVIPTKDKGGITKLLSLFKQEQPQLDKQGMIDYFHKFCKEVLAIDDSFISKAINPAFAFSQINQIRTLLQGSKKNKSYSSVGNAKGDGDYYINFK
jgi:hypothetical protein